MNAYFFKMTNEERSNILDQHKQVYDGYATSYIQPSNEQPLYIQDMANDKQGLTVSNKGVVTGYKNMNINEMRYDGKSTGLFSEEEPKEQGHVSPGAIYDTEETFESEEDEGYFVSMGEQLDMIGDGPMDLNHGTFGRDTDSNNIGGYFYGDLKDLDGFGDDDEWDMDDFDREDNEYEEQMPHRYEDKLGDNDIVFDFDSEIMNDVDTDEVEGLLDNLKESLDMFKRFTKYN